MSCTCSMCSADQYITVYVISGSLRIKANDVKIKDGSVSFRYLGKEIAYFPNGTWRGFIYDGYQKN